MPIEVLDTSGYVPPGSTGSQTTEALPVSSATTAPQVGDSNSPCIPTSQIPIPIGGTSDCQTSYEPLPTFQTMFDAQEDGTMYVTSMSEPTYETDYHTIQMPIADTNSTSCSFAV